jgi:hypothetical protein
MQDDNIYIIVAFGTLLISLISIVSNVAKKDTYNT